MSVTAALLGVWLGHGENGPGNDAKCSAEPLSIATNGEMGVPLHCGRELLKAEMQKRKGRADQSQPVRFAYPADCCCWVWGFTGN